MSSTHDRSEGDPLVPKIQVMYLNRMSHFFMLIMTSDNTIRTENGLGLLGNFLPGTFINSIASKHNRGVQNQGKHLQQVPLPECSITFGGRSQLSSLMKITGFGARRQRLIKVIVHKDGSRMGNERPGKLI